MPSRGQGSPFLMAASRSCKLPARGQKSVVERAWEGIADLARTRPSTTGSFLGEEASSCQQQVDPPEPSQVGPVPASRPASTPAAQPTPARTRIAPGSQFFTQAPHSMQAPRSATRARLFSMRNTACGQTRVHMPQPLQRVPSKSSVTTSSRYLMRLTCSRQRGRSAIARSRPRLPQFAPARRTASRAGLH